MPAAAQVLDTMTRASMHGEFMAFVADEGSQHAVRDVAHALGWPPAVVQQGGIELAMEFVAAAEAPNVMVVDVDEAADVPQALGRLIAAVGPGCRIVALGSTNDVHLFRRLMDAGAADYIVKPLTAEVLRHALHAATRPAAKPSEGEAGLGRLTVVVGARGGVGASTIAVNTAWLMAHERKLETALLDLDLHFGTSALSLDLEPGRGLREALENPDRLDGLLIASSMATESDRLCVLGAEEPVEDAILFDTNAVTALIQELRRTFANVVIDLPRFLLPTHRRSLAAADAVVVVSDLSLAGIRDTARLAGAVESVTGNRRCLVVASRAGGDRKAQVDRATFERGIGAKLAALVPEDAKAVRAGANSGKALGSVARGAPATKALRELTNRLCPDERGSKAGLFGRFRKAKRS